MAELIYVTRYAQSCLLVELGGVRFLVDPGTPVVAAGEATDIGDVEAVLYTHAHADHFDPTLLETIADGDTQVIADPDVAAQLPERECLVLDDGAETEVGGVSVRAHTMQHCLMVDGSAGPSNTGFLLGGILLHPGDSTEADVRVPLVAVPLAGPDISTRDAYRLLERTEASTAVAIHYDIYPADPARLEKACEDTRLEVLAAGQTAEFTV